MSGNAKIDGDLNTNQLRGIRLSALAVPAAVHRTLLLMEA